MNEDEYSKAIRVKGYGSPYNSIVMPSVPYGSPLKVHIEIITSVEQYITEINKLHCDAMNPIFYRGHPNANYLLIPSTMRSFLNKEEVLYEEFRRRFYNELSHCFCTMEQLVFMQHYSLPTRLLDITENALLGLFFACVDDKRFCTERDKNKYNWGEVLLFHALETEKSTNYAYSIKAVNSSTASICANTGFLSERFSLQSLDALYRNDNHSANASDFIYFRDILRRSVIVRVKQDNPRIRNQQGAFIVVNANEIEHMYDNGTDKKNNAVAIQEFTDYILTDQDDSFEMNLDSLRKGLCKRFPTQFQNTTSFDFRFKKINPYSLNNTDPRMQNDPFDLRRLYYKNAQGEQVVFLIPPSAKQKIKNQLAHLNITAAFVYPEPDSVCNELVECFS